MKIKLLIAALMLCGTAQASITDVKYNCGEGFELTVGFNTITVDGQQYRYMSTATGTGQHENGQQYDITGSEYTEGWIFVRGNSALSGLLVHEENFWYCEAI